MTEPEIKYVLIAYVDGVPLYNEEFKTTAEVVYGLDTAEDIVQDRITIDSFPSEVDTVLEKYRTDTQKRRIV